MNEREIARAVVDRLISRALLWAAILGFAWVAYNSPETALLIVAIPIAAVTQLPGFDWLWAHWWVPALPLFVAFIVWDAWERSKEEES